MLTPDTNDTAQNAKGQSDESTDEKERKEEENGNVSQLISQFLFNPRERKP